AGGRVLRAAHGSVCLAPVRGRGESPARLAPDHQPGDRRRRHGATGIARRERARLRAQRLARPRRVGDRGVRALQATGLAFLLALPFAASANDLGRKVFTEAAQPPCAVCHTLEAAGATGTIGPSLDELKPDKARVLEAVRTGIGVMPRFAD